MNRLKDVIKAYVKEYNKHHSPEAKAEIVKISENEILVKFAGSFCRTCGVYDYFEDFVYLLEENLIKVRIAEIKEGKEEYIVKFEVEKNGSKPKKENKVFEKKRSW